MCFGGAPATINMPNMGMYDLLAQQQIDAIRSSQSGTVGLKQLELNQALRSQEGVLQQLRDTKIAAANDTAANAARMAALIGTPPPEKTAQAPVLGSDRAGQARPAGKRGLRIDRPTPTADASGSGLNIPGGI